MQILDLALAHESEGAFGVVGGGTIKDEHGFATNPTRTHTS
jgi:hypothetical protein